MALFTRKLTLSVRTGLLFNIVIFYLTYLNISNQEKLIANLAP
ncbi:hypothetical protein XBP1_2720001 [Xenorhabdus bovienii str. puntauvense]|uniref:Uncharacterized protein n=1 Tax=Xenorhabdus bovienii str. puntauvense TaxID=1398201 RepID=A0A077N603_XENBV|nr:hypothetical protein XBFFR1_70001 [Xenorhabdus bovienii str. feltiae France]CDG93422.1 hypothetical protein XBFFL1_2520006 [Xenorhabdus bovienii str. feltiae Florida]CDG97651.1 hypothetical protein XBP1_2720001 [Xenorhabdus bovienii str. puntauvense]